MYAGSLDGHEAMHTHSHAPHSLVICSSKGGSGTSQAHLPTHTRTSSGQLGHLAVTAWHSTPHKYSTAWWTAFQTMVCACAMVVNGLGVCVHGTWSLGECHSKRRVHTYVRKSALVFTMILLETHPTELLYLQLKCLGCLLYSYVNPA